MIGRERRGEGDGSVKAIGESTVEAEETRVFSFRTPFGRIKLKRRQIFITVAVAAFLGLLRADILQGVEANRCFAILIFCTILWATEVISPLPVSSRISL